MCSPWGTEFVDSIEGSSFSFRKTPRIQSNILSSLHRVQVGPLAVLTIGSGSNPVTGREGGTPFPVESSPPEPKRVLKQVVFDLESDKKASG
jgi:hypothetical protein